MSKAASRGNPPLLHYHNPGAYIRESKLLEPEFYAIADWAAPQTSATPVWLSVWMIEGVMVAHPSVIEKIKKEVQEL